MSLWQASHCAVLEVRSAGESFELGKRIAGEAELGTVILLHGDLGMGKTTLAHGIADALGVTAWRGSPTFDIVHDYMPEAPLIHIDAYRITETEFAELDLDWDTDAVTVIEWADRIGAALPRVPRIYMDMKDASGDKRWLAVRIEHSGN
jgi:tRNA threonylcarbamoyladenosine biosynthesis protein TsaE